MPRSTRRMAPATADPGAPGGYTPPANPEAEQSVLGAILVRPEVLDRVADLIEPVDFYREAHGRIFQAMLDLYGRGEPVDLVTVTALLKERGQLEGVGGPVFLAALSEQVGFATNAVSYAGLVHDKSVLRRLLDTTQEIASACFARDGLTTRPRAKLRLSSHPTRSTRSAVAACVNKSRRVFMRGEGSADLRTMRLVSSMPSRPSLESCP